MPYWKPLVVDGVDIDLTHLETFEFELLPIGATVSATIRVIFNNHCFSAEFDKAVHSARLPDTHVAGHESRAFDRERYELSKSLRDHIEKFPGQRVSQARTGTLVKVTLTDGRDYAIFFTLKQMHAGLCEMFVITAYPIDANRQVAITGEMRFNLIVAKVLAGQKMKFPNGRY